MLTVGVGQSEVKAGRTRARGRSAEEQAFPRLWEGQTDRLIEGHKSRRGREVRTEDGLSIIWRLMVVGTLP